MPKHLDIDPLDPIPAHWTDAIQEYVSSQENFFVRVKPGSPAVLQVPGGPGDDQVSVSVQGRYRWVTSPVETSSPGGAARVLDVYVTASENVFVAGSPGAVDQTNHAFSLAIVEHDAAPSGVALKRKVAETSWTGSKFKSVLPWRGGSVPVAAAALVPRVTALPTDPLDGETVDFMPSGGSDTACWRMRWSSVDGIWLFVGGGDLVLRGNAANHATIGGAFYPLNMPLLALAYGGEYVVSGGVDITQTGSAGLVAITYGVQQLDASNNQLAFNRIGTAPCTNGQVSRAGGATETVVDIPASQTRRLRTLLTAPGYGGAGTSDSGHLLVRPCYLRAAP